MFINANPFLHAGFYESVAVFKSKINNSSIASTHTNTLGVY